MKKLSGKMLGAGAVLALALTACTGGQQTGPQLTASGLDPVKFDTIIGADTVKLYTLKGDNGMEVCITNFGGRVVSLMVPDRDGQLTDVVLGFDNIEDYLTHATDYGSSVGRYANRINLGRFTLNDSTYQLTQNDRHPGDRNHCLHGGGTTGWMNKVYKVLEASDNTLKLQIESADGDNGFPGNVVAVTTYKIVNGNTLDITWEATTDQPTIINQTNHNYYNLSGELEQPGYDQILMVNADSFTVADDSYMPTGEVRAVEGTPMDFRQARPIKDGIGADFDQIQNANGGYDHNWCLNTYRLENAESEAAATLYSEKTGIFMEMFTNEPGVQVYTGNFQGIMGEENVARKLGKHYPQYVSVCLESQKYPDSPNHPEWPSPVVTPEKPYYSHAAYKFSVK
ncbi:MAG: galactose mutarotase [Prevotella sp.]|nr:galactose mutarotase [Prevotella sp.]